MISQQAQPDIGRKQPGLDFQSSSARAIILVVALLPRHCRRIEIVLRHGYHMPGTVSQHELRRNMGGTWRVRWGITSRNQQVDSFVRHARVQPSPGHSLSAVVSQLFTVLSWL